MGRDKTTSAEDPASSRGRTGGADPAENARALVPLPIRLISP